MKLETPGEYILALSVTEGMKSASHRLRILVGSTVQIKLRLVKLRGSPAQYSPDSFREPDFDSRDGVWLGVCGLSGY